MSDIPTVTGPIDQNATPPSGVPGLAGPGSAPLPFDHPDDIAGVAKGGARAKGPDRSGWPLGSPGLLTVAASIVAVTLSAVSLYETVLKPAKPTIYISDAMLLGHRGRPDDAEAVVLPVTIANYGSREAVVTTIRLAVRRQGQTATRIMSSAYSGDIPRAERLFTAVAVAGHYSAAGGVVFTPADDGTERVFSAGAYEFCLTIREEADDGQADGLAFLTWLPAPPPPAFRFSATIPDFDNGQLDAGTVVPLKTTGHPVQSCDFGG